MSDSTTTIPAPESAEETIPAEGTSVEVTADTAVIPAPEGSVAALAVAIGAERLTEARTIVSEVIESQARNRARITEVFVMLGAVDGETGRWVGTFASAIPMVGIAQMLYPASGGVEYLNHARRQSRMAKMGADLTAAKSDDVRQALQGQADRLAANVAYSKRVESLADLLASVADKDHERRASIQQAAREGKSVGSGSGDRPGARVQTPATPGAQPPTGGESNRGKPTTVPVDTPVERTPAGAPVLLPVTEVTGSDAHDALSEQATQVAAFLTGLVDMGDASPLNPDAAATLLDACQRLVAAWAPVPTPAPRPTRPTRPARQR